MIEKIVKINGFSRNSNAPIMEFGEELIRCKDCEHYAGEGMYCAENILVPFDHFYCYYSVRKENDKTD